MKRLIAGFLVLALLVACVNKTTLLERVADHEAAFAGVRVLHSNLGHGTGFIVQETDLDITLVTAAHVLRHTTPKAGIFTVKVLGIHPKRDIAVVRVAKSGLPVHVYQLGKANLGDSAIGLGFAGREQAPVQTRGFIVSLQYGQYIVFNGGVQPGMSGGPVVTDNGLVVGVCSQVPDSWGHPNPTLMLCEPTWLFQDWLNEILGDN